MLLVILLLNLALFLRPIQAQLDPSWVRDNNIDAGESKAVNFDRCRTSPTPQVVDPNSSNFSFPYTQHFNKTDFTLVPKVAMAKLSYDFFYVANAQMGYRIVLNQSATTKKNFTYRVQIVGVKVCGLHFMYIAIQHVYDPFYMIQVFPLTFSTSDPVANTSAGATRVQTIRRNYPNNFNLPAGFSASNYAFQTWILSLVFSSTTHLSINITCSLYSTTEFELTISVADNFILKQLNITAALVDRVKIFEYTYSIYIDQIYNNQPGNFQMNITNLTTITDFFTQYFYRNTLSGLTASYIPFHTNLTYFYFYQSSSNISLFTGYGINLRTRSCANSSFPYYFYQTMKCIASCPAYYFTNSTYKYCIKCHYSCQSCSAPGLINACTTCEASKFRELVNGTVCSCAEHYFDNNTVLCQACHSTCLTCSNDLSTGCLTCDAALQRILNVSSCLCKDGFYQDTTCFACQNNCQTCSFLSPTSTYVCLSCNSSNNRSLDNSNTSCNCLSGYYEVAVNCLPCDLGCLSCTGPLLCSLCDSSAYSLLNGSCILATATCGNGVMQLVEECDDNNIQSGDGCSSTCQIESSYTCINNASLYAYSLCYYSGQIALNLTYVYKVPLQNAVQITMLVSADNINKTALKIYLQTQTAVTFIQKRRLLSPASITQQTFSYDISTSKLKVSFNYNSDIDLSTFSLQFQPSLSNAPNVRSFYATPATGISLVTPYNKLLTTYLLDSDLSKQEAISWIFLALIVISWVYLLISIAYKQSAMALQFFMVLQVTYQSLLQSGFIYDGWVGLIFFGKYTYGVNVSNVIQTQLDTLSTIDLNIPLINTLNIIVAFCFLAVLIILIIFIYQMVERSKQLKTVETKAANDKIELGRQTTLEFNHSSYELKQRIFLTCLQAGIVVVFITFRIVVISMCLAIKQSSSFVTSSLFPALVISACAIALFLFYYKFFDYQGMSQLSYRRILANLQQQKQNQNQPNFSLLLSNFLIKYHYLLIFILMSIFAIVDAVSNIGSGLYLSVAIGAVVWWLIIAFNGNYLRKLHTVRSAINSICLLTTMVTLLLQTFNVLNPSQNIAAPLAGLSLLFFSLIFNATVLIRIEYKRRRKSTYKKRVNKIKNGVILNQKNPTEEASVQISGHRDKNEGQIDRSVIHLGDNANDKQKFQQFSASNESSRDNTTKKFQSPDRFNSRTRHKKYPRAIDNIQETAPKGWNIQQAEQYKQEHLEQASEEVLKKKIAKQLDFQNV